MLASPIINPVVLLSTYFAFYRANPGIFYYRIMFGILISFIIGIIIGMIYNDKEIITDGDDCECHINNENKKAKKSKNRKFDYDIVDEVYMDLSYFITFAEKQKQFIGKTIRIRGFVNKHEQYVPKGYFAIGKYGVSCCTADAGFVGFFVKETEKVVENNWYEIKGILEKAKDSAGYSRIAIKINNIKEIDSKKEEEYVYPCYSYKDGKCEEMKKYNFEY